MKKKGKSKKHWEITLENREKKKKYVKNQGGQKENKDKPILGKENFVLRRKETLKIREKLRKN